jgi:ubiquinol-cytochrome c reductase cytochrome c subunit
VRRIVGWVAVVLMPAGVAIASLVQPPARAAAPPDEELGARLYASQCASCHASDGSGVDDRGPSLAEEGAASADFVLRTGRMPLAQPYMQTRRRPVQFTEEEIVALVAHVAAIGDGPDIPEVDTARGSLAAGSELYQLNCAACHVAAGSGAVIGGGLEAPSLMASSPTEVAEAVLVGPGAMPVFGAFDAQDLNDVAAYVEHLQEERTTSTGALGGVGPVAEGLAAWLIGLVPLLALCRWIGRPDPARDDIEAGA